MSDPEAPPAPPAAPAPPGTTSEVEDAGPCRKRLRIRIPPERVREELDRAFVDVLRHVRVPGFRQGHVPRRIAEAKFGGAVRDEVRGTLLEKAYGEALDRHGLVPLSEPEVKEEALEVDPAKAIEFEVTVEVRPVIALPDLATVSVRRPMVKVEEADVARAIDDLRTEKADLVPVAEGGVAERDVVVADAEVLVGGEKVLGAENIQYRHPSEVVAGVAVPGVSKEILGKRTGDVLSLRLTLPGNFRASEHAGKEADLRLSLREVKRFHLPELDEAFAKSLDFDSLEELRAEARRAVERRKSAEAARALDAAILDAILAKAPVELPEGIVKREIGQVLARWQADLHMQGASQEQIDEKMAEIQGEAATRVEREFRATFLADEIAKKKGLFVTEAEIDEQVSGMAARYGRSPEEMRRHLEQRGLMPSLRGRLREGKVLEALRREVRIEG